MKTTIAFPSFVESYHTAENLRYERKFTATTVDRRALLLSIRHHPALFREIFYQRQINNIYLDTRYFDFYRANKIGIADRKKVRIRWYGDTFGQIEKPKLEFKLKSGLVGDKWTFRLPAFTLDKNFNQSILQQLFETADLPSPIFDSLKNLQPALVNCYQRTYFRTADGHFRMTFDEKMAYYRIFAEQNTFLATEIERNRYVFELKYGIDQDDASHRISQHIPYRLDKNSKYVNGIDLLKMT